MFFVLIVALVMLGGASPVLADGDWEQSNTEAQTAFDKGDLDTAKTKWEQALKEADAARAVEPGVVTCLTKLALVTNKRGNAGESERLYELAMRNMEGIAGPESTRFADWMPDLAWLYESHGRPDKSEVLFKRALQIKERAYGKDDPRVAEVLDMYARFLRKQNRGTEASAIEQKAKTIRTKNNS